MKPISSGTFRRALFALPLFFVFSASAGWQLTTDSVAWESGSNVLWQFNFSTNVGKPFFDPLRVSGSEAMTTARPADHLWHYGLWFSWKYINEVNYWEEEKATGRSQGTTTWDAPAITTHDDGSAEIKLALRYVSTNGAIVMTEQRAISVSTPTNGGGVTIDWTATFTAGDEPLLLDRTHMPGEPKGQVNGGYGGFSCRVAQAPAKCDYLTAEGPIEKYESDRARPNSKAAACNVTQNGRTDGIAILSHASNAGGDSPWYISNSEKMRWFSPALLAPKAIDVKPHEIFTWKFRIITKSVAWTPSELKIQSEAYNK